MERRPNHTGSNSSMWAPGTKYRHRAVIAGRPKRCANLCVAMLLVLVSQYADAQLAFQQDAATGLLSIEVENYDANTSQGGHDWVAASVNGASNSASLQASPNNGTNNNSGYVTNSPRLDFNVNFTNTGTHYIWLRGRGATASDDSAHVGLDNAAQSSADRITDFGRNWTWTSSTMDGGSRATIQVNDLGEQLLNVWMREDGLIIDKIVLTTSASFHPADFGSLGPAESPRTSTSPSLVFAVPALTYLSNEGDTTALSQTVSLDTSDALNAGFSVTSSNPAWLTANPVSGTSPEPALTITADPSGLAAGVYNGQITATASGYLEDQVAVTLTVLGASTGYQQDPSTGLVSIEIENFDTNIAQGGHDWSSSGTAGASNGGSLQATPNSGTNNNTGFEGNSPRLDYLVSFTQTGTHYVWLRGIGQSGSDDSAHAGLGGSVQSTSDRITGFGTAWTWTNVTMDGSTRAAMQVDAPGDQTLNIWMREDGLIIDKVVLTTDASLNPADFGATGPVESPRGPAQPGLDFDVATLAYAADEGDTAILSRLVALDTTDSSNAAYNIVSSEPSWLSVDPALGDTPATNVAVSVATSALAAGSYTGTLTATADGYLQDAIEITLIVSGPSAGFQQDPVSGLLSIEVENFATNTPQGGHDWDPASITGQSGAGSLIAAPNNGTNNNTGYTSNSPRLDYQVNFTQVGTHYVWLRGQGPSASDDSAHVGLNGSGQSSADRITGFNSGWTWTNTTMDGGSRATVEVLSPGDQTLNIWMREDGLVVDKIVLTTDATLNPADFGPTGPAESPRGPPAPALMFGNESLAFNANEGDLAQMMQAVSLDTTDSSVASYELDSSAPSWLTVSPATGTTPEASVTVTAAPAGLPAGVYSGAISAVATGFQADSISVTMTVAADLFVVGNFDDGDASAWTSVEASGDLADWQVIGGEFQQLNSAAGTAARSDTYLIGTYAFLNTHTAIDDFEFSVDVTPLATAYPRRGDDIGVMFRYVDDNNYYRLSVNSKFGYTRLERRIAGQFSTIAVTSQGYYPGQSIRIGVRAQGPAWLIYRDNGGTGSVLDGEPYLAGFDSSLAAGSVALYTQSEAAFDNILVKSLGGGAHVGLISPVPFLVDADSTIATEAVVINASGSATVQFEADGLPCIAATNPQPALFVASCVPASAGEHQVDAILYDPVEVSRAIADAVATEGVQAITLGNSITNGTDDKYRADNISVDIMVGGLPVGPRQVSFRGYQTVLHDQLTIDLSYGSSNVFFNEGIPGDNSAALTYDRAPSIVERHPEANIALVTIGTNDANQRTPPSSGLGCAGTSCNNTFKGNLLDLVDTLGSSGISPIFAKIPPIFGLNGSVYPDPLSASTRNSVIMDFNAAIDEVASERGLLAGPDFFGMYLGDGENHYPLYDDFLHPNSLGYVVMAHGWKQIVAPDGTSPFILNGLCVRLTGAACDSPSPYKQNLLELGNTYYTDRSYTLTAIPIEVSQGIWISTANSDKGNSREDYLTFGVDRDVDVYVAFTPTASSLPTWMDSFSATGLSIGVTAGNPALNLYAKFFASGSVISLGGNVAAGISGGGNNNFVVIVVAR